MRLLSKMTHFWSLQFGLFCLVCLLLGCPETGTNLTSVADMGTSNELDTAIADPTSQPDQQLFQTRRLAIPCEGISLACDGQTARINVQTDSQVRLTVVLTENEQAEEGTLVRFSFVDNMGTDIPENSVEGSELQVRSVSTDYQGVAHVMLMTGFTETDLNVRAYIPGIGEVEWLIEVRRERVGRLEIETEYQPGSQNRGSARFDSVDVYLLPDNFNEASCDSIETDPSALTIHAVREASGVFEVTTELFESLVVFESTDSEKFYLAVAVVSNASGEPIGVGCRSGISVEPEATARFTVVIEDITIPLDYKGEYRVMMRVDMSGLLNYDAAELSSNDRQRLTFVELFQQFRTDLYDFRTGRRDRAQIMMDLFCNYITFSGEQCSQIESYIVRGLLGPLIEDVIVPQSPAFLDALAKIADVYRLLETFQIDAVMNIRNRNPDSFGYLRGNELRFKSIEFGAGTQCTGFEQPPERCEYRSFATPSIHIDHMGGFTPLVAQFDADSDGNSLQLLYHEMEIRFGLMMTRLLETWILPAQLNISADSDLLDALDASLPCLPIDQFVGDDPFCQPFLLANLEHIIREMLAQFSFGGRRLGFAGSAQLQDDDGDRVVDQFKSGRLTTYLPELVSADDDMAGLTSDQNEELDEMMQRQERETDLVRICFSACRCVTDLCGCTPETCEF